MTSRRQRQLSSNASHNHHQDDDDHHDHDDQNPGNGKQGSPRSTKRPAVDSLKGTTPKKPHVLSSAKDPLTDLFNWLTSQGADLTPISFSSSISIRGAIASQDIPPNSLLGYLPPHLILSETTAKKSDIGFAVSTYLLNHPSESSKLGGGRDPYAQGMVLLASFIAHEHFVLREKSFWSLYLDSLPSKFNLPLEWPEEDVRDFLRGTNVEFIVKERRRLLEDAAEIVNRACVEVGVKWSDEDGTKLEFEQLLWAYSAIASRAFPKPVNEMTAAKSLEEEKRGEGGLLNGDGRVAELCLYPGLDMLNHQRGRKIEWNSVVREGMSFITPVAYKKGETLWNNYGPKGNENLLSNYGFVLDPNPEDYHKVALNLNPADPLYDTRLETLQQLPSQPGLVHLLFADDPAPPSKFLDAARVLVGKEEEIVRMKVEGGVVGARCDVAVYNTLWTLLQARKSGMDYTTTEEEEEGTGDRARHARLAGVYRRGQVSVLNHHITLVEKALQDLLASLDPSPPPSDSPSDLLHRVFITPTNPLQDSEMSLALVGIEAEDDLDEETIVSLMLIRERSLGEQSQWSRFFESIHQIEDDVVSEINGDQTEDIIDHFSQVVRPCLRKSPSSMFTSKTFNKKSFLWAASVLDKYGVSLNTGMVGKRGDKVKVDGDEDLEEEEEIEDDEEGGEARFGVLVVV
ncbi:hypothetical protein HDV05_000475 [Chytridiales sp. JEL 0842]|nr:hypothetical protein HDV05_000475 [Chytridiales sp. JEL 0842]